ncbi:MAG TPA: PHP domain-containing protein [Desulfobacteraceae bacterium]|nr:PHP domain-containing protein [Desulfobacteraceae bacterium]
MCVDLHLHSNFSDGSLSPSDLVERAVQNGLRCIALTDHDTVEGIGELFDHGRAKNMHVLSGVEISATHGDRSLHILGYGIDHTHTELHQFLQVLQRGRTERNAKIIAGLQRLGFDVDLDQLQAISRRGQTGRPHIAALLLNKGIVGSKNEAFKQYLRKGAPAWAGRTSFTAAESIDIIHRAGGIAVLAHPGQLDPELRFLPQLVAQLVGQGLDGIEAYYPTHPPSMRKRLLALAKKYTILATGGSDYHGDNGNYASMARGKGGFCPPDSILAALEEKFGSLPRSNTEPFAQEAPCTQYSL